MAVVNVAVVICLGLRKVFFFPTITGKGLRADQSLQLSLFHWKASMVSIGDVDWDP